jgi:hypothetical protein
LKVYQLIYSTSSGWNSASKDGALPTDLQLSKASLVFFLGEKVVLSEIAESEFVLNNFANAQRVYVSTAGEIADTQVLENVVVATAIEFSNTFVTATCTNIKDHNDSESLGKYLLKQFQTPNCKAVMVLSDGTFINGSDLVAGCNSANNLKIPIMGGLAGDGIDFNFTLTGLNKKPEQGNVIAIGFSGESLMVNQFTFGGWDEFGPERVVTKAIKNVLYELDNKNALELYKDYLGRYSSELPASALLFPLSVKTTMEQPGVTRTILSIDNDRGTMTFAGNIPEGSKVRLMKANFDALTFGDGRINELEIPINLKQFKPQFCFIVSCIGRKIILKHRIEEEIEAVKQLVGDTACITGFYSYGEISINRILTNCELYNQTITVSTFYESAI